jgi:cytochrome c55X
VAHDESVRTPSLYPYYGSGKLTQIKERRTLDGRYWIESSHRVTVSSAVSRIILIELMGFLIVFARNFGILIALCAPALLLGSAHAEVPEPDKERQRALVHLVRQDCGSCHGLTLQGGLGPALTVDALRDKPPEGLVATIVGGRPGTPMPPFRGILSEADAEWVVEQLMAGFPEGDGPLPAPTGAALMTDR